ncbi:sugar kinase [Marinobacter sp.]|uniref:sugar kinase n=1 Tax=Marinobacter sp. TaxID=50741 RepID=UPI002B46A432|nr:sugar kinase [Marinobacter sp.]HKK57803.1 sugar kinase [Marinobacter sp.]
MADLLCLGEPLVEFNVQPDGSYRRGFGGDVSNVAISAARQGAAVGMISRVGADPFGEDIVNLWQNEGVDTEFAAKIPDQDTGLYFVHHDREGHHFIYRRQGSACSLMTGADIPAAAIADTKMFYASGITIAVSSTLRAATAEAVAIARKASTTVAFDPNLRERLWPLDQARAVTHEIMRDCAIALPGLDDARRLTGLHSPEDIINFYHDLGAAVVALTLGGDGVAVSSGDGISTIPPLDVSVIDATGAGDCFNGIFLSDILRGRRPEDAAETANIGAALSTTGFGAVAPIPFPIDIKKTKETSA